MDVILKAEKRDLTTNLQNLRNSGWVPGCVYGKTLNATPVKIRQDFLQKCLNTGAKLFHLNVEGSGKYLVGVEEIQKGFMNDGLVHISFHAVSHNESVTVDIPIHFIGSAKGISTGGVFQKIVETITIKGKPANIPDYIEVDVSTLEVGHSLHLNEVKIVGKFEILENDKAKVIAVCNYPKKQELEAGEHDMSAAMATENTVEAATGTDTKAPAAKQEAQKTGKKTDKVAA
jgi:large subunit ribosomal protein L25